MMDRDKHKSLHETPPRADADEVIKHELDKIRPAPMILSIGGLLVLLLATGAIITGLMYLFSKQRAEGLVPPPLSEGRQPPPPPRLQVTPVKDLAEMRDRENAILNTYGWVDKQAGVVRIPIERSIEVVAAKGLPARNQPPVPPPVMSRSASGRTPTAVDAMAGTTTPGEPAFTSQPSERNVTPQQSPASPLGTDATAGEGQGRKTRPQQQGRQQPPR